MGISTERDNLNKDMTRKGEVARTPHNYPHTRRFLDLQNKNKSFILNQY